MGNSLTQQIDAVERAIATSDGRASPLLASSLRKLEEVVCGSDDLSAPKLSLCNRLGEELAKRGTLTERLLPALPELDLEVQKLIGRVFVAIVRYNFGTFNDSAVLKRIDPVLRALTAGYRQAEPGTAIVCGEMLRECLSSASTFIDFVAACDWWWKEFVCEHLHRTNLAVQLDAFKTFTLVIRSKTFHDGVVSQPERRRAFFNLYHKKLTFSQDDALACDGFELLDGLLQLWRGWRSPLVGEYFSDVTYLKSVMLGLFREPDEIKRAASRIFGQFVIGLRSSHIPDPKRKTHALCCGGRLEQYHEAKDIHAMLAENRDVLLTQLYKFDAGDPSESRRRTDADARWRCFAATVAGEKVIVREARSLQSAVVAARRIERAGDGEPVDFERLIQRLVRVHLVMMNTVGVVERARRLVAMGRGVCRGGGDGGGDARRWLEALKRWEG